MEKSARQINGLGDVAVRTRDRTRASVDGEVIGLAHGGRSAEVDPSTRHHDISSSKSAVIP